MADRLTSTVDLRHQNKNNESVTASTEMVVVRVGHESTRKGEEFVNEVSPHSKHKFH